MASQDNGNKLWPFSDFSSKNSILWKQNVSTPCTAMATIVFANSFGFCSSPETTLILIKVRQCHLDQKSQWEPWRTCMCIIIKRLYQISIFLWHFFQQVESYGGTFMLSHLAEPDVIDSWHYTYIDHCPSIRICMQYMGGDVVRRKVNPVLVAATCMSGPNILVNPILSSLIMSRTSCRRREAKIRQRMFESWKKRGGWQGEQQCQEEEE